ncbi:hypothetical protein Q1695_000960 [Nippostrongylus brasiliensis]|nr:hypothetical protein Q1695_000960 [Nippostrongylus brasiliensis]
MVAKVIGKGFLRMLLQAFPQPAVQLGQGTESVVKGVGCRPAQNRGALLKLCFVTLSSLYLGGYLAHKGASYLEENEIFVPSDDDDDD